MRRSPQADSPPPASGAPCPSFADSAEKRIVDLELRYMGLERAFDELSQVVAAQQHVIDALTIEAKRRREGRDDGTGTPVRDEPPPHY